MAPTYTSCPILWSDDQLLVIDKPAGLLSHPNPGGKGGFAAFPGHYEERSRRFDTPAGPLWLIHRLDQDTSGTLMAALDEATARTLRQSFENGEVKKHYFTMVAGRPRPKGIWKDALSMARGKGRVRTTVVAGAPLNAELHFQTVAHSHPLRLSLLETELVTGRTHQIRVQAASRGHPVLGDDVYGDFALNRWAKKELGLRRLFLHAAALGFHHPVTRQFLKVVAPLPAELAAVRAKAGL
jgi:RluA family pseudouridine synthase